MTTAAAPVPTARVRHGNPRIAQLKRTWYFMRRNTLAMVGLTIIVVFAGIAIYGGTQNQLPWNHLLPFCSVDYGPDNSLSGYRYYNNTTGMNETGGPYTPQSCGAGTAVCTYTVTPPPNAAEFCNGHWYPVPTQFPSETYPALVAPTFDPHNFYPGPLPLGSLEIAGENTRSGFYSISEGVERGADWSLIVSASIVSVGAATGLIVGAVAGTWGGRVDEALMRLVDVFLSIPTILFVIVVVTVVEVDVKGIPGLNPTNGPVLLLILAFAAVWWPFYARIVRGQVLVIREQKYVEAARASGASRSRILVHHIIPNSMYPIFVQYSLDVGTIPLLLGTLVFLGFQIWPVQTFPEWGTLAALSVNDLQGMLDTCQLFGCVIPWWQLFFPGFVLFLWGISVNLLSDGLRDALDPRLRR